jgi:beta-lactamase regulating signal transducer with metallopeptidase domain
MRRPSRVLLHDEILAPVTYGLARPTIGLPSDVSAWSDTDVLQAVVHELEHVHRGDWLISLVSRDGTLLGTLAKSMFTDED